MKKLNYDLYALGGGIQKNQDTNNLYVDGEFDGDKILSINKIVDRFGNNVILSSKQETNEEWEKKVEAIVQKKYDEVAKFDLSSFFIEHDAEDYIFDAVAQPLINMYDYDFIKIKYTVDSKYLFNFLSKNFSVGQNDYFLIIHDGQECLYCNNNIDDEGADYVRVECEQIAYKDKPLVLKKFIIETNTDSDFYLDHELYLNFY